MQKYDVLTDIEHVLKRPDTYGGSTTEEAWNVVVNGEYKQLVINPMLLKIFDEAIVNAADHKCLYGKGVDGAVNEAEQEGRKESYDHCAATPEPRARSSESKNEVL